MGKFTGNEVQVQIHSESARVQLGVLIKHSGHLFGPQFACYAGVNHSEGAVSGYSLVYNFRGGWGGQVSFKGAKSTQGPTKKRPRQPMTLTGERCYSILTTWWTEGTVPAACFHVSLPERL